MGTTNSTPAGGGAGVGKAGSSKTAKPRPPPPAGGSHGRPQPAHLNTSSPSTAKKNPRNYIDMGVDDEEVKTEQGKSICLTA